MAYKSKLTRKPAAPKKDGVTFEGWQYFDKAKNTYVTINTNHFSRTRFTMPAYDVVFTPLFRHYTRTLRWVNAEDGELIKEEKLTGGTPIKLPDVDLGNCLVEWKIHSDTEDVPFYDGIPMPDNDLVIAGTIYEHKTVTKNAAEADCEHDGYTGDEVCEVCGKTVRKGKVIRATGHKTSLVNAKEATCTKKGYTGDKVCTVCSKKIETGKVIEAKGHELKLTKAVAPTCEEAGSSAYWTCTVCGKYFSDADGKNEIAKNSWILEAKGHALKEVKAKAATCTETGNTAYWTCTACGRYFSDAEGLNEIDKSNWLIPAKGHSLTKTEGKPATCAEAGSSAYWTCSACGKYFSDAKGKNEIEEDSWILEAKGHDLTKTEAVDPTCLEGGNSAYWTCSVCGKYFSDAEGKNEIEEDSWILDAKGHSPKLYNKKRATFDEAGYTGDLKCSGCGELYEEGKVIDPICIDNIKHEKYWFPTEEDDSFESCGWLDFGIVVDAMGQGKTTLKDIESDLQEFLFATVTVDGETKTIGRLEFADPDILLADLSDESDNPTEIWVIIPDDDPYFESCKMTIYILFG